MKTEEELSSLRQKSKSQIHFLSIIFNYFWNGELQILHIYKSELID